MIYTNIFAICILLSGCSAYKVVPDRLPRSAVDVVLDNDVKINIGYHEGKSEDWLASDLVSKGLAKNVLASSSPDNATYLLNLDHNHTGKCFSEPMLTAITFGIIPSIGCAEVGYYFQLLDRSGKEIVRGETANEVETVFGLASWFLMLSPSWVGERGLAEYEASLIIHKISVIAGRTN